MTPPSPAEIAAIRARLEHAKQALRDNELNVFDPSHHASWADIEDLLAALDAAQEAQRWQPIETAPKEGRFDVWAKAWLPAFDRFECRRFADCYWREACSMGTWKDGIVGVDRDWRPTHWMPLPAPPVAETPDA